MLFDADKFNLEDMYPKTLITVKFKRPVILWPKNPFWNIVARCRYVFKLLRNKMCSKREEKINGTL